MYDESKLDHTSCQYTEYETQVILSDLSGNIKDIMMKAKMSTVLEMMVAHLGAYLGFMSVAALGDKQAKKLKNKSHTALK